MTEDQIRKDERRKTIKEIRDTVEEMRKENMCPAWIASYKGGITFGFERVLGIFDEIECEMRVH